MSDFSWEDPYNFLGLGKEYAALERAKVALLPVPYEATTSYVEGTRRGPEAILQASRHVELYDHELDAEPYRVGIHTHPMVELTAAGPEAALAELRERYAEACEGGQFVIMLGGEHTITQVPVLYWADRLNDDLTILQFDAHADLRDSFHGTRWSHACVMRRVVERVKPVGVGIRAIDSEEKKLIDELDLTMVYGEELGSSGWVERVLGALSENVYISFDVDFFDPAFLPATGTPEPGGGTWEQAMALLRSVFSERRVIAADVVELAPLPGVVAPDFLVAKLVYKMIGYWDAGKR
ncbi:MAG: agmatinase [Gemmatimonadota bacterium]|nr:MAG: agmatinase [Gemmatimonadota bacterium]